MGKLLLFLSFISLLFLSVGTSLMPNSQMFIFASTSTFYEYAREALAAVLLLLLVTHPPRHILIRLLTGGAALVVAAWAVIAALNGLLLLDSWCLLGASTTIGIAALEINSGEKSARYTKSSNPLVA